MHVLRVTCWWCCGACLRHVLVMLVHVEKHLGDVMVHWLESYLSYICFWFGICHGNFITCFRKGLYRNNLPLNHFVAQWSKSKLSPHSSHIFSRLLLDGAWWRCRVMRKEVLGCKLRSQYSLSFSLSLTNYNQIHSHRYQNHHHIMYIKHVHQPCTKTYTIPCTKITKKCI